MSASYGKLPYVVFIERKEDLMDKLKIEYVDINSIKPYSKNAKRHPKKQIEQIKKSIEDFNFNDPIAIDENNVIIERTRQIFRFKRT